MGVPGAAKGSFSTIGLCGDKNVALLLLLGGRVQYGHVISPFKDRRKGQSGGGEGVF